MLACAGRDHGDSGGRGLTGRPIALLLGIWARAAGEATGFTEETSATTLQSKEKVAEMDTTLADTASVFQTSVSCTRPGRTRPRTHRQGPALEAAMGTPSSARPASNARGRAQGGHRGARGLPPPLRRRTEPVERSCPWFATKPRGLCMASNRPTTWSTRSGTTSSGRRPTSRTGGRGIRSHRPLHSPQLRRLTSHGTGGQGVRVHRHLHLPQHRCQRAR